jgi:hypothetical protein
MTSLQPTKESGNYFRLSSLLIDGGKKVLRAVLQSCHASEPKPGDNLVSFLRKHRPTLYELTVQDKPVAILTYNWNTLYPPAGHPAPVETDFDLSLLCCLLTTICQATPREMSDIHRLRTLRNVMHAHCTEASVTDALFTKNWKQIRNVLLRLAKCCGADFETEVTNDVTVLETASLDVVKQNEFTKVAVFVSPQ